MRRFLIIVLCAMSLGNAGILFAGDAAPEKQYGLAQWTLEDKEQSHRSVAEEKHGLGQWTLEGREQERSGSVKEEHGLSRWTLTDKAQDSKQKER